jgi:polysaccharide biosynthesis protein PslH
MGRETLLLISPVVPAPTGGGLAMRAFLTLRILASRYSVCLLIADMGRRRQPIGREVSALTRRVIHKRLSPAGDPRALWQSMLYRVAPHAYFDMLSMPSELKRVTRARVDDVARAYAVETFDRVHVFRLYMAPFIEPLLERRFAGTLQLDLDDIESLTRRRLSDLYRLNADAKMADIARRDAEQYERLERRLLPSFDRVFVCSSVDKAKLHEMYGCRSIGVFPNAIEIQEERAWARNLDRFVCLFIGSLGYYPNQDAVRFFCAEVLPLIVKSTARPVEVVVAGKDGDRASILKGVSAPQVRWVGRVENVDQCFQDADAVIVPVRAGGGTRIKILEAFSHRRPVIATSIGIEGIDATHGRDVLVADTAEQFAAQVLRVIEEPSLGRELAENGFRLLASQYSIEQARKDMLT